MAIPGSPLNAVPNGISYPATPPSPQQAQMAMGGGPGVSPPGASMSPPGGPPLDSQAPLPGAGADQQEEMDIFQRVVALLMDPQTKQLNMPAMLIFAGLGAGLALEKSGKFVSKPHRSNEQLAQMGFDTGMPGQTGMQSPEQMQAPTPQGPGMPGFG